MSTRAYSQTVTAPPLDSNALLSNGTLVAFPSVLASGFDTPVGIANLLPSGDSAGQYRSTARRTVSYGLGFNSTNGTVQLYGVSSQTGMATAIRNGRWIRCGRRHDSVRIGVDATTVFGMDFNPTVDRVRVVNSAGQNFRMNPNNGALVDFDATTLGVQMDGGINGPTMSVQETAIYQQRPERHSDDAIHGGSNHRRSVYSESAEQRHANDVHAAVGAGGNGAGLRYSVVSHGDHVAFRCDRFGHGSACAPRGAPQDELVNINLSTGAVTTLGPVTPTGIIGVALQAPATTPTLFALSGDGTQLFRILSTALATPSAGDRSPNVTLGETLVGIDFRLQTGQLFSLAA